MKASMQARMKDVSLARRCSAAATRAALRIAAAAASDDIGRGVREDGAQLMRRACSAPQMVGRTGDDRNRVAVAAVAGDGGLLSEARYLMAGDALVADYVTCVGGRCGMYMVGDSIDVVGNSVGVADSTTMCHMCAAVGWRAGWGRWMVLMVVLVLVVMEVVVMAVALLGLKLVLVQASVGRNDGGTEVVLAKLVEKLGMV